MRALTDVMTGADSTTGNFQSKKRLKSRIEVEEAGSTLKTMQKVAEPQELQEAVQFASKLVKRNKYNQVMEQDTFQVPPPQCCSSEKTRRDEEAAGGRLVGS